MRPSRIVSLVPSLTELVVWLGAGDTLVGRTKFCTDPPEVAVVPAIGGTKDPDIQQIVSLRPDLVLANREENRREDVEALQAAGLDVVLTDPNTVDEALTMIAVVGARLDCAEPASRLVADVEETLASVAPSSKRFAVVVWRKPLMVLGSGTYGHDLLRRCGGENVFAELGRYPSATKEEIADRHPDVVLLPDEPFPFKQRHVAEFASAGAAVVVDGKALWWYGPRMPEAVRTLAALLHAEG